MKTAAIKQCLASQAHPEHEYTIDLRNTEWRLCPGLESDIEVTWEYRSKPPVCTVCNIQPWDCASCGDYRCNCPNPFQVQLMKERFELTGKMKKPRLMGALHYDKTGIPYKPNFLDGYEPVEYADEEADTKWLIEGGFTP